MITEENHSYEQVVGNPQMPYYNWLIHQYGLAEQFYSDQHSSLPALMWYVAGGPVELNNDTVSCLHANDNVVRELLARGYTWRSYQEGMPSSGFQGLYGGTNNIYYRRHNPLIDFTDVCPGTGQEWNSVPFTEMAADFAAGYMPSFAYITPDVNDDAHNGTLPAADAWLQANVPAILARPEFGPGGDGILFIIWDEGDALDNRCSSLLPLGCGGRTATLVIGPRVRKNYQSTFTYHSENVLATVCAAMGLWPCPGAAAIAAPMADFFSGSALASPAQNIVISNPANASTVAGAVHLTANVWESQPVSHTEVWDNGSKLGVYGDTIDAVYNLAPGWHQTWVLDLDTSYHIIHENSVSYNVTPLVNGLQVITPTPNAVFSSTAVHVQAQANEAVPINQMQVWDNGVKLGWYPGGSVNQYYTLAAGFHIVTVLDLDGNNNILHETGVFYFVL
jgi:acid phosphatase